MIRYNLVCKNDHEFEGWFGSSAAFDAQREGGQLRCPYCDSSDVSKAVMAPNVVTGSAQGAGQMLNVAGGAPEGGDEVQQGVREAMRRLRDHVVQNSDYVGERFAEEARKIHHEESEERGIYGEANAKEVSELREEGIDVFPLPVLPEDQN